MSEENIELEENKEKETNQNVSVRVSAQALKVHFLNSAWPIVDAYIGAALGTEDIESLNSNCREEVWDLVKQLMIQSSDKLDLQITNVEDILKAVENGDCTFEEGDKLMSLYKKAKEIENHSGLGGGGDGLTINILNSTQNQALESGDSIPAGVIELKR